MKLAKRRFFLVSISAIGFALGASGCLMDQGLQSLNTGSNISADSADGLSLAASSSMVSPSGEVTLTATGGVPPYNYLLSSGVGNVVGTSYFAGPNTGPASVEVQDDAGNSAFYSITVEEGATIQSGLAVTLSSATVLIGGQVTVSATNGVPPYSFAVLQGGGFFESSGTGESATYVAPGSLSSVEIEVVDSTGLSGTASIAVQAASSLNAGGYLAVYSDIYVAFDMPTSSTLKPALIFGEASSTGCLGFGVDSTCTSNEFDTASNASYGPASNAIVLENFNAQTTVPYTGQLIISLQASSGTPTTTSLSFCVSAGDSTAMIATSSGAAQASMVQLSSLISFPVLASGMASGTAFQEIRMENVSPSMLQTASIEVVNANFNPALSGCSGFTSYSLMSRSNQ